MKQNTNGMRNNESNQRLWLNFYSIKSRISLSFLVVMFLALAFVLVTAIQINTLINTNKKLSTALELTQRHLWELNSGVHQSNLILQRQIIFQEESFGNSRQQLWEGVIKHAADSLNESRNEWATNEIMVKLEALLINLKKLRVAQKEVDAKIAEEKINALSGKKISGVTARNIFQNKVLSINNEVQTLFDEIKQLQRLYLNEQDEAFQKKLNWFWNIEIILLSIFILSSIVVAYNLAQHIENGLQRVREYTTKFGQGNIPERIETSRDEIGNIAKSLNDLSNNLNKIKVFAEKIGQGKFEENLNIFNNTGELGEALSKMHQGLLDIAQRDRERNWSNEGVALFGNIIRRYENPQQLYDEFITNLVRYLRSEQGGLFILNEQDSKNVVLELKSMYAFDRKRFEKRSVKAGQGLLGQAWLEKEHIYIDNISEEYLQITSGLGGAPPRYLLVVPMLDSESQVVGGIEIAAFHGFADYEIDFVDRVATMLGGAVSSMRNTEKNQKLLEEAQRATQKMSQQEQEMRRNLESLIKTQKEMERNQIELEGQTNAIDKTLATLELNAQGVILYANHIFLEVMGYTQDEVKGQDYSMFLDDKGRQGSDYQALWKGLQEGIAQTREVRRVSKSGKEVWFSATYTPVYDHKNKLYKIIKLSLDITEQKRLNLLYKAQLNAINQANGVIEFDTEGRILRVNDLYCRFVGYSAEELIGQHHRVFITPEEQKSAGYARFWQSLAEGENIVGKFKRINKNQEEVWIRGSYNPVFDLDGKVHRIINLAQDVSHEHQIEQQVQLANNRLEEQKLALKRSLEQQEEIQAVLRESQVELENRLNAIDAAFATAEFDPQGNILQVNKRYLEIFQYQSEEIIGTHHQILLSDDQDEEAYQKFWKELQKGNHQIRRFKRKTKENQEVRLYASYLPIPNAEGEIHKIIQVAVLEQSSETETSPAKS